MTGSPTNTEDRLADSPPGATSFGIDTVSKALAITVTFLYISGFLITSIYDFRFGFAQMNPLRPRILTAGGWFFLATAIPLAMAHELRDHEILGRPTSKLHKLLVLMMAYYSAGIAIYPAYAAILNFDPITSGVPPSHHPIIVFFVVILLSAAIYTTLTLLFGKFKNVVIWGCALVVSFIGYAALKTLAIEGKFDVQAITLWFFGVGIVYMLEMRARSWKWRLGRWQGTIVMWLCGVAVFGSVYYPHIKASWGGGGLIPVTITMTKDAVADANQSIPCRLIDETDSGFYVLERNETTATYIPRSYVAMIRFGSDRSGR